MSAATACPSYTAIPEHQRVDIQKEHAGEIRWLKQSMFAGTFYDDDRYQLVSAIPFQQVTVLRSLDGEIMTPPPAEEILPAGTKVRIERVGFPTGREVFRRPLFTPRYTTWIVMRVAASRGETKLERDKKHILLMPTFLKDEQEFDTWLDASLADEDPNPWLRSLPKPVREGIFKKQPALGMTYEALTAAMGYPDRVTRTPKTVVRNGRDVPVTLEVAIYGATSVVLEDGRVIRVSDPASGVTLETEPPAAPASPKAVPPTESRSEVTGVENTESESAEGEEGAGADATPEAAEVTGAGSSTAGDVDDSTGNAGVETPEEPSSGDAPSAAPGDSEVPPTPASPPADDAAPSESESDL